MASVLRRNAFALCLLGLAFLLQFQMAKHWRPWAAVCPFVEDPYDAVGSFAVQFVLFMMIVSLFRGLRRLPDQAAVVSFTRGALMTSVAIGVTCLSDLIAMARHVAVWLGRPQGIQLFVVTALLLVWSVAAAAWFVLSTRTAPSRLRVDRRRFIFLAAALAVLAVYPEDFRSSVIGAILTALCGSALLFMAVWSVGTAFSIDCSDTGSSPRRVSGWRRGRLTGWALAVGAGLACGAFLVAQELAQPGPSPHGSRRILVIAVYLFLESAGVVTGYALLAEPLDLAPRR